MLDAYLHNSIKKDYYGIFGLKEILERKNPLKFPSIQRSLIPLCVLTYYLDLVAKHACPGATTGARTTPAT
jgi:hypothetical protein